MIHLRPAVDGSTLSLSAIFPISFPSPDIYLIIRVTSSLEFPWIFSFLSLDRKSFTTRWSIWLCWTLYETRFEGKSFCTLIYRCIVSRSDRINNDITNKQFNFVNVSVVFECRLLGQRLVYAIFSKRLNKKQWFPVIRVFYLLTRNWLILLQKLRVLVKNENKSF